MLLVVLVYALQFRVHVIFYLLHLKINLVQFFKVRVLGCLGLAEFLNFLGKNLVA